MFFDQNRKLIIKFLPLCTLLVLAVLNFFLLLRHKSPYVTDSYFYNHVFYRFQGYSFDESYNKILEKIDIDKFDKIGKNFFLTTDKYQYTLSRYIRRPLYPFTAFLLNLIVQNEYLAFILPNFFSYVGCFILLYLLFRFRFDNLWSTFGTALFIGFYPFLDWSTYFLTDTIGAFFWLLQIYLVFRFVQKPKNTVFVAYVTSLIISLFNRELGVLLFIVILPFLINARRFKLRKNTILRLKKLFIVSAGISLVYIILNRILNQPSLYDSWIYLQSNFGYNSGYYPPMQTMLFLINELVRLHQGLFMELIRHRWWGLFTLLGFVGVFQVFFVCKKPAFIDMLILSSSAVAYIGLIIVPFLSYRYFYPTIIGVIYFSIHASQFIFAWQKRKKGA